LFCSLSPSTVIRYAQDIPQGGLRDPIVGADVSNRYDHLGAVGPVHTGFVGVTLLRHQTCSQPQQQLQLASGLTGTRKNDTIIIILYTLYELRNSRWRSHHLVKIISKQVVGRPEEVYLVFFIFVKCLSRRGFRTKRRSNIFCYRCFVLHRRKKLWFIKAYIMLFCNERIDTLLYSEKYLINHNSLSPPPLCMYIKRHKQMNINKCWFKDMGEMKINRISF